MPFTSFLSTSSKIIMRRDSLGAFAFVIAAISGKLAATRFVGDVFPSQLFEVRLWTTITAAILLLPFARSVRWNPWNTYIFGSIVVLATYLILRAPFGASSLTAAKATDLIYLVVLCYLMLIVASDTFRMAICGATVLAASSVLFLLAFVGVAANPELNGAGWAAIGGPLTFYRLEFLGFCCTLWMILRKRCHPVVNVSLLGAFLFATLASLSKAAYGAATIVLLVVIAGLIAQRNWRPLGTVIFVFVLVFVGWHSFLSSNFYARTSSAFTSQQVTPTPNDLAALDKRFNIVAAATGNDNANQPKSENPVKAQREGNQPLPNREGFLAPGFSFLTEFRWCVLDDTSKLDQKATITCHEKTVIDKSQRLFFLFKALESPTLLGHGIASFHVPALNPGAGYRLEQYNYPHNVILELLYDSGIVGVGLLVVALMFSIAGFFRFVGREPAHLAMGGYGLFIFLSGLAAGDFYDFRLFWFVALAWATSTGAYREPTPIVTTTTTVGTALVAN